ncbi:MAG TPA: cyclase family protein [Candidatus Limnocylindria bacterium]|nr:cyclase family protein [Candidatus Limnocylindria bacterium]
MTEPGARVSLAEFEAMFESVKNWGRWGSDDQLGTLNYITPEHVRAAAGLVRSGRTVSMEIPINTVAGPDNPNPAIHFVSQGHDIDIGSGGLRFGLDFMGMACHGDCHTHIDALCHISYNGLTYNGKPAEEVLTSKGATTLDIASYGNGLVGRGVLLDVPRFRGVDWLEPGEAVTRAELEACEQAQGVRLGEGDILVFRTGHHGRRLAKGAWDNGPGGEGKAGLHVDTIPWMHERKIAAFLPDGDGEAIPSVVDGMTYPIHPLQIVAMGMLASDSLQFEDLARACREEGRFEFMVVGLPLRLPGGTGSPWNPIAIF